MKYSVCFVFLLFVLSCESEVSAFKKTLYSDTEAAWENYLAKYPQGEHALTAQQRLAQIVWKKIEAAPTAEAIDAYVKRFPRAKNIKDAMEALEIHTYQEALKKNTVDGYEAYLEVYPEGKYASVAKRRMEIARYIPDIELLQTKAEKTNMQDDPKGPLDGFGVMGILKNGTGKTLLMVEVSVDLLDSAGKKVLATKRFWPVLRPEQQRFPCPPEWLKPLSPKQERKFRYTFADAPSGWALAIRPHITDAEFK